MGVLGQKVLARLLILIAVLAGEEDRRRLAAELARRAHDEGDHLRDSCHCICPIHRDSGMFCMPGTGTVLVMMIGGLISPQSMPMCGPCAGWWQQTKPRRIVATHTC